MVPMRRKAMKQNELHCAGCEYCSIVEGKDHFLYRKCTATTRSRTVDYHTLKGFRVGRNGELVKTGKKEAYKYITMRAAQLAPPAWCKKKGTDKI